MSPFRLLIAHGIAISMDGRGASLDNIFVEWLWRSLKYLDIYLKSYGSVPELTEYFGLYKCTSRWATARRLLTTGRPAAGGDNRR